MDAMHKATFRLAFNFLEKWLQEMEKYQSAEKYWQDCFSDLHAVCFEHQQDFEQQMLLLMYEELEKCSKWKK